MAERVVDIDEVAGPIPALPIGSKQHGQDPAIQPKTFVQGNPGDPAGLDHKGPSEDKGRRQGESGAV